MFQFLFHYLYFLENNPDIFLLNSANLSTAEIEKIVVSHQAVAEYAVIGVNDELNGQKSLVTKLGEEIEDFQLQNEVVKLVRDQIGAVASLRDVVVVNRLSKTRSGKILRKLLRSIADGENFQIPSTIDDEAIIGEVREVLELAKIGCFKG